MRRSAIHIFSSLFLISSLLFTQVAVNFFHRNHDVHEVKSKSSAKNEAAEFHQHSEHCNVCAIDFFNQAFDQAEAISFWQSSQGSPLGFVLNSLTVSTCSFHQGRAPPIALS